ENYKKFALFSSPKWVVSITFNYELSCKRVRGSLLTIATSAADDQRFLFMKIFNEKDKKKTRGEARICPSPFYAGGTAENHC
ncbi:MAG: hypothetical protein IJZ63_01540, partial [Clostridia bacterium]|nr:hypothetical protein [Clostridia bacterium]